MNIAELFARIGLKTDEHKAKSFLGTMKAVKLTLIATTVTAGGTALAIRKIASDAMKAAVAFKQFETETGASAQQLQKWQAVAEQTNQSAESVSSAIKAIVSNQEKIKLGQGDISGYQILGIDPRQDPFKILEDLREKSKGLSDGMKKNILSQIGVGAGLLQTLNLTRKEFDEMAGRAWIISPQAIETLNQTKSSVDLAARAIGYMKAQIAVGLSPQIKKLTKDFQSFMKTNEKAIIEGFKKGFKFVSMFVKAIYNAGKMLNKIVSSTIGWENALKGLLGIIVALNAAFLLSPMGLFIAGIVLLVAILEDLYVFSKGGKSLFGVMMKEFPALEKVLFGSFRVIRDVFNLIKAFASGDDDSIKKITDKWGLFGKAINGTYKAIKNIIKLIKAFGTGDEATLKNITEEWGLFGEAIRKVYDLLEKFKNLDIGLPESVSKKLKEIGLPESVSKKIKGSDLLKLPGFDPASVISSLPMLMAFKPIIDAIRATSTTQNNSINVNVTGNGDPVATGNATAKAIQREINAASAQLPRNQ